MRPINRLSQRRATSPVGYPAALPWTLLICLGLTFSGVLGGFPGVARADDANAGRDIDGVYTVESLDVEMLSENITIEIFTLKDAPASAVHSRVRCEFVCRNRTDKPLDVLMAFPAELVPQEFQGEWTVQDFMAFLGETELPVALEPASAGPSGGDPPYAQSYASWYTFTVPFAPGEERTVVNTYWVRNTYNSIGEAWVNYILKTGATWSGPIGKATVTVLLGPLGPQHILNYAPSDWRFAPDGRSLVWQRENFEPDFDLSVRYSTREFVGRPDNAPARKPEFERLIAEGPSLPQEELLAAHAAAVVADDAAKVAMLRAFLAPGAVAEHPPTLNRAEVVLLGASAQESEPVLEILYSDAGGDIATVYLEVAYNDNGQRFVYHDYQYSAAQDDSTPAWTRFSWTYRVRLAGATPGKPYELYIRLTDATGRGEEMTQGFSFPPTKTPSVPAEPSSPGAAGHGPVLLGIGLAAMSVAAVAVVLILRKGRRGANGRGSPV